MLCVILIENDSIVIGCSSTTETSVIKAPSGGRGLFYTASSTKIEVLYIGACEFDTVSFPTWSHNNGQDDIKWHNVDWQDNAGFGDDYRRFGCTINKSEHNNESGTYSIHVYGTPIGGTWGCLCQASNVVVP